MNDYREISRRILQEDPRYRVGAELMDNFAAALKDQRLLPDRLPERIDPAAFMKGAEGKLRDPYDSFTQASLNCMTFAEREARGFHHQCIGTEHILLGLTEVEGTIAHDVLSSLGIAPARVRDAIEFIIGKGDRPLPVDKEVGLTPRGRKVVALAIGESKRAKKSISIEPQHLLLGLAQEGQGIAAGVLESFGVHLERVRAEVTRRTTRSS